MTTNDELQQQLIKDLLIESFEGLDRFDREMLALEKGSGTTDTPNVIFRVIHTIKGTAGCLGLTKIESVAHVGENLLSALREGKVSVSPPLIDALLAYADTLREMLRSLETERHEGEADYSELLRRLQDLNCETAVPTPPAAPPAPASWGLFEEEPAAEMPVIAPQATVAKAPPVIPESEPANRTGSGGTPANAPSAADSAIRVNVDQLDKLMNLVGELVLA
ncbi:MAG TPA: Hpt domain-containing protein, partial [Candidatus Limnocylindria bacterium]|nr:Hpt domain-containing protein [Candidatus Limnocylindria bacterium]